MLHCEIGPRKVCSASRLGIWGEALGRVWVSRAQAVEGAACLKGTPSWHCGAIQQPRPFLRQPHGGSREPMRRDWSRGQSPDTLRQTMRPG